METTPRAEKALVFAIPTLLALVLYGITAAPHITLMDAGDLITSAATAAGSRILPVIPSSRCSVFWPPKSSGFSTRRMR